MKNIIRNALVTILVTAGMLNFAFSQNGIVKYKDKINSNKEYEIEGQDILDVINTIDSLENVVDSLFWTLQDVKAERDGNATALENFLNNSKKVFVNPVVKIDTIYTQPDTVYLQVDQSTVMRSEFWIIGTISMIFGAILFKFIK
tara:strand:- start:186 stop:620 length:435 start_codon:yes stop_codon:yes gene_type:complete